MSFVAFAAVWFSVAPEGLSILGISFSGAGNAKREFADEGDKEHNPRQLSCQVSNT